MAISIFRPSKKKFEDKLDELIVKNNQVVAEMKAAVEAGDYSRYEELNKEFEKLAKQVSDLSEKYAKKFSK
jgi:hypothetical protein